jgi:hypothetical protein
MAPEITQQSVRDNSDDADDLSDEFDGRFLASVKCLRFRGRPRPGGLCVRVTHRGIM